MMTSYWKGAIAGKAPNDPVDKEKPGMSESDAKMNSELVIEAKVRGCLVCKTPFQSAWSGERICHRCKSTSAWRSGVLK